MKCLRAWVDLFHFAFCKAENSTMTVGALFHRELLRAISFNFSEVLNPYINNAKIFFCINSRTGSERNLRTVFSFLLFYLLASMHHLFYTFFTEYELVHWISSFCFSSERGEILLNRRHMGKAFCIATVCCLCSLLVYAIITSRISKKSRISRASENIESSIWADALRLRAHCALRNEIAVHS